MNVSAGEFKAKCLKLMDEVKESHQEIIITKFGKPVARLTSIEDDSGNKSPFGFLKGSVVVQGDIVTPIQETWNAEN